MHLSTHITRFALLTALIASIATPTHAQTQQHDVTITLPAYIGIRIVGTGTGPRSVTFDYVANPNTYFTAIDAGGGTLPPTAVSRFDDVEVNISRNGRWRIHVLATTFAYTGPAAPAGLALGDIRVDRTRPQNAVFGPGNSARYATFWTLSTTATEIASSNRATGGWRSLGFSGWDYSLRVDGDEAGGTYFTVVTYSLTAP